MFSRYVSEDMNLTYKGINSQACISLNIVSFQVTLMLLVEINIQFELPS